MKALSLFIYTNNLHMQLSLHANAQPVQNSTALVQLDLNETSLDSKDDVKNGGFSQAESLVRHSQVVDISSNLPFVVEFIDRKG